MAAALEVVRERTPGPNEAARLYKLLARPMPTRTRELGGTRLNYVDVEQVVSRLNSVLGADGWSFAVTERWHEQDSDCCCVRGLLSVHWPSGRTTHHEDIGGQVINRRKTGAAIEIANDWKGAQSDCLKRCATQIGVGLFLRTKQQHVSEMPTDRPERDHAPRTGGEGDVSKTAASVPAAVAQGRGAGGGTVVQHGVQPPPPVQPALDYARTLAYLQKLPPADAYSRQQRDSLKRLVDELLPGEARRYGLELPARTAGMDPAAWAADAVLRLAERDDSQPS